MALTTTIKSDGEIHQDVIRELKWDSRVDETDVGVEVDRGVVTLTGVVDSYTARQAAQRAAHQVFGVKDVANDIHVRAPGERTDTDIALAVRTVLDWDPRVSNEDIRTTVADGWVTLEGEVDRYVERTDAERAVQGLPGVRGVTNLVTVGGPTVMATNIKESIEEALERRAERQAEKVQVQVHDGVVRLSGSVRSFAELRAVAGAAGHAPGVRKIENYLTIDPYM